MNTSLRWGVVILMAAVVPGSAHAGFIGKLIRKGNVRSQLRRRADKQQAAFSVAVDNASGKLKSEYHKFSIPLRGVSLVRDFDPETLVVTELVAKANRGIELRQVSPAGTEVTPIGHGETESSLPDAVAAKLMKKLSSTQIDRWAAEKPSLSNPGPATEYDLRMAVEGHAAAHPTTAAKLLAAWQKTTRKVDVTPKTSLDLPPLTKANATTVIALRKQKQARALEEVVEAFGERHAQYAFGHPTDTYAQSVVFARRIDPTTLTVETLAFTSGGPKVAYRTEDGRLRMRTPTRADYEAFATKVSWNQVSRAMKQIVMLGHAKSELAAYGLEGDVGMMRAYAKQHPHEGAAVEQRVAGWSAAVQARLAEQASAWATPDAPTHTAAPEVETTVGRREQLLDTVEKIQIGAGLAWAASALHHAITHD